LRFAENGTNVFTMYHDAANSALAFYDNANTTERMRIDSSGNVSIGTSATSAPFRVNVGTDQNCAINTSGGNPRITAFNDAVTASVPLGFNGSILKFETGGDERMRIDSSGNVLVGTTSTTFSDDGIRLYEYGAIEAVRASYPVMHLNRRTSDGDIAKFYKDGSSVGSIGTSSGYTKITSGDGTNGSGLQFGDSKIYPVEANSVVTDNAVDFGDSNYRFKDLYLSGAVNLGGDVLPTTDAGFTGHSDLGDPAKRFEDAYVRDGVTTGSDGRDKQDIAELDEAEYRVAVACKSLLRKWRWKSSVEEKGDDARIHFGIIAQDLKAAFEAEGLDAGRYAMFISSTWTDEETGEEKN